MISSPSQVGMLPFRDAFLDAPIGIIVVDPGHLFVEANPSFLKLVGYTRDELIAMGPLYSLTHPDDHAASLDLVRKLRAQEIPGFTIEKRYITKGGAAVWVQLHTSLLRDSVTHAPVNILGLIVDITARKGAEQHAAVEAARARSVIEATSDGVYTINRNWQITYVNQSAIDAVGFKLADLGGNFWELYPKAEATRLGPALRRAMYDRLPVEFEDFYPDPVNIHYTASIYPTDEGVTVFYRDITEKRRAELALRESEKMAVVGRLAASIAHEINNPLEAITNLLYLARGCNLPAEAAEYLRIAESEIQRVSQIASLTLSFRRKASTPSPCTAKALFDSVVELYRSRLANSGVTPVLGGATGVAFECQEGEMRQVLANLVANSIDAMRCGGKLHLRAHSVGRDPLLGVPAVRLTIADTGHGIPHHMQRRIFDAFFTTKELGGTGLGLWLSKSIVENQGGRLALRSCPGRGTVFSVCLPIKAVRRLQAVTA